MFGYICFIPAAVSKLLFLVQSCLSKVFFEAKGLLFNFCFVYSDEACQEKDGPFPWPECKRRRTSTEEISEMPPSPIPVQQPQSSDGNGDYDHQFSLHGLEPENNVEIRERPQEDHRRDIESSIVFKLPHEGVAAGYVLKHARSVMEHLQHTLAPMTFKFGVTHCPIFRWRNEKFGYQHSRDKWQQMIVLYRTHEPYSPSMLEAALIALFQGILVETCWICFPSFLPFG